MHLLGVDKVHSCPFIGFNSHLMVLWQCTPCVVTTCPAIGSMYVKWTVYFSLVNDGGKVQAYI